MGAPKRKPWICTENGCFACEGKGICDVPEDCSFTILHALELLELGLQERPRRWGKTRAVAEMAAKMMQSGCDVTIVTPTYAMCEHAQKILMKVLGMRCQSVRNGLVRSNGSCRLETKDGFVRSVADIDRMVVLTDELKPEEVEELKKANERHDFVLGYYTRP